MILYVVGLTLVWCWIVGSFAPANVLGGAIVGSGILLFLRYRVPGARSYFPSARQVWQAAALAVFFVYDLVLANLRLAAELLTPGSTIRPGIVAVPLDAKTNAEITLFATLLTLTPGTLTIDISQDRKWMYVHGTNVQDEEEFVRAIKSGFESRVLELLR